MHISKMQNNFGYSIKLLLLCVLHVVSCRVPPDKNITPSPTGSGSHPSTEAGYLNIGEFFPESDFEIEEMSPTLEKRLLANIYKTPDSYNPDSQRDNMNKEFILGDVMLTREQMQALSVAKKTRRKRKIVLPTRKWTMPILYKVDSLFSDVEESVFEESIREWMKHTCIRFEKVPLRRTVDQQHLLFSHGTDGMCWSNIGQVPVSEKIPQIISLQTPGCGSKRGTIIHELGHAIGLYYEHNRRDRDQFVKILWSNIMLDLLDQFLILEAGQIESRNVSYDVGSIMHYSALGGSKNGLPTILPWDITLVGALGQRSEISFYDAKIVNSAYCPDVCNTTLPCRNDGYTDPLNCTVCRCPDGYGGKICDQVALGSKGCAPHCGLIKVKHSHQAESLQSPNYAYKLPYSKHEYIYRHGHHIPKHGWYTENDHCNWRLQVPPRCTIDMWFFESQFGMLKTVGGVCVHWVEIQHQHNHTTRGQRFCGMSAPSFSEQRPLRSEKNEVLVIFKSPPYIKKLTWNYYIGFRLYYKLTDPSCLSNSKTTPPRTVRPPPTPETTPPLTRLTTQTPAAKRTTIKQDKARSTDAADHPRKSDTTETYTNMIAKSPTVFKSLWLEGLTAVLLTVGLIIPVTALSCLLWKRNMNSKSQSDDGAPLVDPEDREPVRITYLRALLCRRSKPYSLFTNKV